MQSARRILEVRRLHKNLPDPGGGLLNYPFRTPDDEQVMVQLTLTYAVLLIFTAPLAEALEMGVAFDVARGVIQRGEEPRLPGQIHWRWHMLDGLRWLLVAAVYALPAMIVFFGAISWVIYAHGWPNAGLDGWPGITQGWPVMLGGLLVGAVLGALGSWFSVAAAMHMVYTGQLESAFHVAEWGRVILADLGGWIKAAVYSTLLGLGISATQVVASLPAAPLIFVPALIAAFSSVYHRLVVVAMYAQQYRKSLERLESKQPGNPG